MSLVKLSKSTYYDYKKKFICANKLNKIAIQKEMVAIFEVVATFMGQIKFANNINLE